MTLPKLFHLSARASKFHARIFQPRYEALRASVQQTPLVLMLWGPRRRSDDWSRKRMEMRDELLRLGHTVYFSEELGIPATASTQKGVEFLPSEMADLIIVMQSSYDPIGAVRHFVEFRVIDAKMLMFIDETAPDQRLYQHALNVLHSLYDNIHTYKYPDDILENHLFSKVLERVTVMQMVKYRAIQNVSHWGLRSYNYETQFGGVKNLAVQPFDHNLLELYRNHREEVIVLTNPGSLFLLALVNHLGDTTIDDLASETGLKVDALRQELGILLNGEMLSETDGVLTPARFGKHLVSSVDMVAADNTRLTAPAPATRLQDQVSLLARLSVGFTVIALLVVAVWYSIGISGRNLPFSVAPSNTPPHASPVPTLTITPTH